MADVAVSTNTYSGHIHGFRNQVFTSATVGYQFYVDTATEDLFYKKTTDGGATWGSPVTVLTGRVFSFDVWFDKWTPGDSGTLIHIAYVDETSDDVLYRNLDTSDDSLSTETQVYAGTTATNYGRVTLTKTQGGNLIAMFGIDADGEYGCAKSTDTGANWSSISNTGGHEGPFDQHCAVPGNETDTNDCYVLYLDASANALTLKTYDDSEDSWSETAITTAVEGTDSSVGVCFNASVRLSDGHIIVAVANARDAAGGDLEVWDIATAASITQKTNVITDTDDWFSPCVFIDQSDDTIYVGYAGADDGSQTLQGTDVTVNYAVSGDGADTWGTEQAYSETGADIRGVWCDLGGSAGLFAPAFLDVDSFDLFVNAGNAVAIGGGGGGGGGGSARRALLGVG